MGTSLPALNNHLAVEHLAIEALVPYERKLREHPERQLARLAASIEQFGFLVPILVEGGSRVITGHARIEAARRIGMSAVPAIRVDHLSPAQIRAFRIADNRLVELGAWNEQALALELQDLSVLDLEVDLDVTGFETPEIDLLIASIDGETAADPADDILPPSAGATVAQAGDLWRLGEHRLLCGDALKPESYARLMDGQKARLVFTDPPFNVKVSGHVGGLGKVQHREFAMASGELTEAEFTRFLEQALAHLSANIVDGGLLYNCMDWRHHYELGTAIRANRLELVNVCIWNKTNAGMGSLYRSKHELVFVAKAGPAAHINNIQLGKFKRYRTNVWDYAGANTFKAGRQAELAMHPTVKPVALVADAILDCSRRGEIVLDAFAGSGTTIIAAERTGRVARAIELDPGYVDVCLRRWQKLTGKVAVHADLGASFDELTRSRALAGADA